MARFLNESKMVAGGSTVAMARSAAAQGAASFTIQLQVYDGKNYQQVADYQVKPGRAIRLAAVGLQTFLGFGLVTFFVTPEGAGMPIVKTDVGIGRDGEADLDIQAPSEGRYVVVVSAKEGQASTTFTVTASAQDPAQQKGFCENFQAVLGDAKWIVIGVAVVAGVIAVKQFLPSKR